MASILLATVTLCLADDSGANLVQEMCGACHTARTRPLHESRLTRQQWKEAIDRMARYGATVADEKLPELLDYLARAYGAAAGEGGATGFSSRLIPQRRNNE
jgi:Asp-tRNA(Asn)/Glu-tRNA(Gln) amidotransferase A subunit family amidase